MQLEEECQEFLQNIIQQSSELVEKLQVPQSLQNLQDNSMSDSVNQDVTDDSFTVKDSQFNQDMLTAEDFDTRNDSSSSA